MTDNGTQSTSIPVNITIPGKEATQFALGIKLFGEVMIRHRKETLFEELAPVFTNFMKNLKSR